MDPITHISAGALAASALRDKASAKLLYPFCLVAAWLPDGDQFFASGGEDYLVNHRAITHSIVFAPLLALIPVILFWPLIKRLGATRIFLVSLGLTLTHVYLDWITSYGTQLLSPFTNARYSLSSVFIIDPFLTLPVLVMFTASLFMGLRGKRLAVWGLAFLIAYPVASWGVKQGAARMTPALMTAQGVAYDSFELTTDAFSPMYWKLIIRGGDNIGMAGIRMVPPDLFALEWHDKADPELMDALAAQEPFFATWRWFAGYPAMDVFDNGDGGKRVLFKDLRFGIKSPPALRIIGGERMPFSLTAWIDASGTLTDYLYNPPSGRDAERVPH